MQTPFRSGTPRLVALDLDGTLLTSDKRISARARAAVQALDARGVAVMLCTGRPPRSARAYAAYLGLTGPSICYNGAALYHPSSDAVTVRHHLDPALARRAIDSLRGAFPGIHLGLETDHGWYLEPAVIALRETEARLGPEEPTGVGPLERFLDGGAVKLMASSRGRAAAELATAVADLPLKRTWSAGGLLELLDPRADKRTAVSEVSRGLGIDRHDVAAFGDQRNDVELLGWAGWGVAVANASEEARAVAEEITLSNDEDGVAVVLERWLHATSGHPAHRAPTGG